LLWYPFLLDLWVDICGNICGKISAINLKEIEVKFNNKVDKITAENKDAYVLTKGIGSKEIDAASLQEDGKTVILTVKEPLTNQANDYKLSIANVKSATGESTFSQNDIAFKPLDITFPSVANVTSLGNKAIKVTFTEPVQKPASVASTFKIDGVVASGLMDSTGRTITITLFNKLTDGEHNLTINNNIKDYANYQLVETTVPFTVIEDTVAPTIVEAKDVTLEGATIVFSEDVKKAEAETATNYYWKQGSAVKSASSATLIDGKTVRITFAPANRLPGYATDLFVKNVVDYSGNKIAADSKVAVTAVLDQTKPEVLTYKFDNDAKTMVLTFSKPVDLSSFKASNVVIKDKDAEVVPNGYTPSISNDGKTLTITLTKKLSVGTFSFEFLGMKDTTLLENPMMPFSTTLETKDSKQPIAKSLAGTGTIYILTFDKAMDISTSYSILNPQNYFVTYITDDNPERTISGLLPEGTNLSPTNGNKGVIIQLPDGVKNLTKLSVQGVKDADGNFLAGYAKEFGTTADPISKEVTILKAEATDKETIVLTMDQPMKKVDETNFAIDETGGGSTNSVGIKEAEIDSSDETKVILTLNEKLTADAKKDKVDSSLEVYTKAAKLEDYALTQGLTGVSLKAIADGSDIAVEDKIAPSVKTGDPAKVAVATSGAGIGLVVTNTKDTAHTIEVIFDEKISADNLADLHDNFKVYRADGIELRYGKDYKATIADDSNTITLTLDATADNLKVYDGLLQVVFDNTNENIIDKNENVADGFDTAKDVTDAGIKLINFTPNTTAKQALVNAITAANTDVTATKVSTDGSDILPTEKWVTVADKKTYTDAIAAAQAVVDNTASDEKAYTDAKTTLDAATTAFGTAKKDGTKLTDDQVAAANVAAAKTALTTLTFDTTDNATSVSPKIVKPVNHANGATYTLAVGATTPAGKTVAGTNPVVITRDATDQFTFDITVTISSTVNGKTATDIKVFTVTVPTGTTEVTVAAK